MNRNPSSSSSDIGKNHTTQHNATTTEPTCRRSLARWRPPKSRAGDQLSRMSKRRQRRRWNWRRARAYVVPSSQHHRHQHAPYRDRRTQGASCRRSARNVVATPPQYVVSTGGQSAESHGVSRVSVHLIDTHTDTHPRQRVFMCNTCE